MDSRKESIAATGPSRRALVAGGAGFLGSHLCDRLIAEGHDVVCLDNLFTGRLANIEHLFGHPRFRFLEHDVRDGMPALEVDEVWNLACPASPPRYQFDPIMTMLTNVVGTHNLLELARTDRARFFQASSSEVYGDPGVHPQHEGYSGSVSTTGPRACYDEGKRAAEALCFDYRRHHGVETRVARIFNTYGPRMDPRDGRVVSNFVMRALTVAPLEIYGDGEQTRSFCYVDDLIDGAIALMRAPGLVAGPINIGNPEEISMRVLAETILAMTGSRATMTYRSLPSDDPRRRRPDVRLAEATLGWRPRVALSDGLRRTIDYFRSELANGRERQAAE